MPAKLHRIQRIRNPEFVKSGVKAYGKALRKHRITPTKAGPYSVRHDEKLQNGIHGTHSRFIGRNADVHTYVLQVKDSAGKIGDVSAQEVNHDSEYLCEVPVGTPGQVLKLDFDTGSSDLWFWSTELGPSQQHTPGHTVFNSSKSSTYKAKTGSFYIRYGDNSYAKGTVGIDNINLGGLVIHDQAIELANDFSDSFLQGPGDGLLGLAWDAINAVKPSPVKTPVTNLIEQGSDDTKVFTAHLGTWRDANNPDPTKRESFYTFGYLDPAVLQSAGITDPSQIHYASIDNSQGFWQFPSTTMSINGEAVQRRATNTAIADTGTTLALVADHICQAVYSAIPGARYDEQQAGYIFPANTPQDKLPDVKFAVGDKLFSVLKEDLAYAGAGKGMVYGGIQSRGTLDFDILGDTFLKGIYAIFDVGRERFGAIQRVE